jgi:hypothetical protein
MIGKMTPEPQNRRAETEAKPLTAILKFPAVSAISAECILSRLRASFNRLKPYCRTMSAFHLIAVLLLLQGCAAPQRFWPQKDIAGSETSVPGGGPVVLIASRDTDFKKSVVTKLHEQLATEGLSQKTIGIKALSNVEASDYGAVVVISPCLAWGLDDDVRTFLERQRTDRNIILLTTSGSGAWLPEKGGKGFDAVSAASEMTDADAVAREVMTIVHSRVKELK